MRAPTRALAVLTLTSCVATACSATSDARFSEDLTHPVAGSDAGAPKRADGAVLGSNDKTEDDSACKKMDLVFIVDDSGSMDQEQANLTANFPKFIEVLNKFTTKGGAPIDYRIAATATGVSLTTTQELFGFTLPGQTQTGDNGKFRTSKGMSRPWLERGDANLASTFSSIATVGTDGPSWEMPLQASRLALRERLKDANSGFVRDDALLGIVYLTDEDDCSVAASSIKVSGTQTCGDVSEDVANYVKFFDDLKQGRDRWATAVIAGQTNCHSSFGDAADATRLKKFVSQVGKTAVFSSICDGDLSVALTKALQTFDAACKSFTPPR
jgi:hypothetical protein